MEKQVLIIGFVFPEPGSSAAGNRMMQLIGLFQSKGWKVTFASSAGHSAFEVDLAKLGVAVENILLNDPSFDVFVKELDPDIVLFDRFMIEEQYGWRVAEHCPGALRMLDTVDLHCLRLARHKAWKEQRALEDRDLFSETAKREIASILRCDLSIMISDFEMELLEQRFKVDPALLHYLPLFSTVSPDWKQLDERAHFVFIGNFLHEPNWNAVQYLKESIWPIIRKALPKAEMHVYGAYPSQKVFNLHKPAQGFIIQGRAEDALKVVGDARVCLAPLRFGAGIKGKLLEAMACGTPSVTTDIGAEAMHGDLPWNGFIANDPQAFAEAAIELYSNAVTWIEAQAKGTAILRARNDEALYASAFLERIEGLQTTLADHRLRNFMGAMLLHHRVASTKYMSRWIEGKNK